MTSPLHKAGSTLARPLRALLAWWSGELAGMLPAGVRAAFTGVRRRLLVTVEGEEVSLVALQPGGREPIGRYPLLAPGEAPEAPLRAFDRSEEVVLCLPEEDVLLRPVRLPLATEVNLRGVLGYMMERHTPFSAEQVYYDFRLLGRDAKARELLLELCAAPRELVDRLLGQVAALGLHPDRVSLGCADETGYLPVNLLPAGRRRPRGKALRALNLMLAVLALGLLVAVLGLPLWQKRAALAGLEAELARVEQAAAETRRLQEGVERLEAAQRFLDEKRRSTPLVLSVVGELTSLLPDDTWLNHLSIQGGQVQLRGFSSASATLIPIVESSLLLRGASFRSPVVRDALFESERFDLAARIGPGGSP